MVIQEKGEWCGEDEVCELGLMFRGGEEEAAEEGRIVDDEPEGIWPWGRG